MKKNVEFYKQHFHLTDEEHQLLKDMGRQLHTAAQKDLVAKKFNNWLNNQVYWDNNDAATVIMGEFDYTWRDLIEAPLSKKFISSQQYIAELVLKANLDYDAYAICLAQLYNYISELVETINLPIGEEAKLAYGKMRSIHILAISKVYLHHTKKSLTKSKTEERVKAQDVTMPVTQLWDAILLLPLVGIVDTKRSSYIMQTILAKIDETQANVIILDIAGAYILETEVINSLLKINRATQLMGCHCIISGITPNVAETIVNLDIDYGDIETTSSLKAALNKSLERTGMQLSKLKKKKV